MQKKQGGTPYRMLSFNPARSKLKPLTTFGHNKMKSKTPISTANRTTVNNIHKVTCMNDQLFIQRRQNHMNTCYNNRKNKLKEIGKDNMQLYQRINSQKSLYSQKNLRKSTETLKSNSRCSSRSSLKSKSSTARKLPAHQVPKQKKTHITIESENINKANYSNLADFRSMFMRNKAGDLPNTINQNYSKKNRSFSLRDEKKPSKQLETNRTMTNMGVGMGNMLHRIAEEMLQTDGGKGSKKKRVLI